MLVRLPPPRLRLRHVLLPAVALLAVVSVAGAVAWYATDNGDGPARLARPASTPLPAADTASTRLLGALAPVVPAEVTTSAPPTTAAPTTTEPPTTTTTAPPQPWEDPATLAAMQSRLDALGYGAGVADGRVGARTSSALLAFEKVEGLDRDGEPGPAVLAALEAPQGAVATGGTAVPRVEIDLARQVIFVVTASGTRIFNTSTGSGEPFTWPDGTPATAYTPTGDFSVLRRVDGIDDGPLGSLYRPLYFYDGWAIHGSGYVPAYPASHGCARVSDADQNWIWDNVANGTPVIVY